MELVSQFCDTFLYQELIALGNADICNKRSRFLLYAISERDCFYLCAVFIVLALPLSFFLSFCGSARRFSSPMCSGIKLNGVSLLLTLTVIILKWAETGNQTRTVFPLSSYQYNICPSYHAFMQNLPLFQELLEHKTTQF